ncbi:hypothetical protein [Erwinia sp. ErVv1]|nr:hypothetical protein [Erwinia sp. ErVv1]
MLPMLHCCDAAMRHAAEANSAANTDNATLAAMLPVLLDLADAA